MAAELSPIALALGRVPTGLYVVTTRVGGTPLGFVGSFVMQVGFEPPTLSVAIGRGRDHLTAIRESGRFAVSVLDGESQGLMKPFFKSDPANGPFDQLEHHDTAAGSPVLDGALAWLDCLVTGEHDVGDHVVVFGEVREAHLARGGDPSIRLRRNGLDY
jgi:flavin reductase (DIM6/NTAB) family NADH-FMN oxidoreductase RutF